MTPPTIPRKTPPPTGPLLQRLRARLVGSFSHTPRTVALVYRSAPRSTVMLLLLTLAMAALPVAIAWAGKGIVDAVVARDRDGALRWVLLELGLIVGQSLAQRGLSLLRQLLGARLSLDINTAILAKAQAMTLADFEDPEFYDRLTRARREASSRPLSVITEGFQLVQNTLTLAGYAALLIRYNAVAVGLLLLASVPATVAELRFSNVAFRLRNWRSPETRRLAYLEYVLANDDHVKEVKLFGLGATLLARYRQQGEAFFREDRTLAVRRALWAFGLSLLGTAVFYGCYASMALAAAAGALGLGSLTLYLMAFRQGQQAFQSILSAVGGMYEDNLYMANLFEFLGDPDRAPGRAGRLEAAAAPSVSPAALAPPPAVTAAGPPATAERGLRFEDVGFRYPQSGGKRSEPGAPRRAEGPEETWALRHINLHIPAGQSLALVGHNGAGKTTFVKLLTRLYEPTEGRILLDGRDLRDWEPEALRQRYGVIFQDFNQYQFSFRENVGVGSVAHLGDEPRILRATTSGGAEEVLARSPGGLDTQLGRWFQDGVELSGGQWQKVALSRGFMREEADLLILDEPTAALDAEAEHAVFERFRLLAKGRTTLVISHRFPTVRMADRIIVLSRGEVVEEGTHDSLIAADGLYARLFALQAAGYR